MFFKLRKHTAFILIILISVSLCAFPVNADKSSDMTATNNSEISMTTNMKLINSLKIEEFEAEDTEKNIPRWRFGAMVCRILGYSPDVKSAVSRSMSGREYMELLSDMNIIKGYSDGEFRENNSIKYDEALVIAVSALGYGVLANEKGGYPYGYRIIASEKNLLKNIKYTDEYISCSVACDLCINMLKSEYLRIESISNNDIRYSSSGDGNLLEDIFGVKEQRGILDGVALTRLAGDNDIPPGYFSLDGSLIYSGTENLHDYLGFNVNVYYKTDNDREELIYIEKTDKNREYIFDIKDVKSVDSTLITYENSDGYIKKYKTESYKYLIYNGTSSGLKLNNNLLSGKNGNIRLLDNDNDGAAEIIFVDCYEDYVVSQRDDKANKIYDKLINGKSIELDTSKNDPYVVINNSKGAEISFGSIAAGNVVSVYQSAEDSPQMLIKAIVSSGSISGKIEIIENDGEAIVCGGKTYKLTDSCRQRFQNGLKEGCEAEILLNAEGLVSYINIISSSFELGYLVNTGKLKNNLDADIEFKIFHNKGITYGFDNYKAGKYYSIDDVRYENGNLNDVNKSITALNKASQIYYGNGIDASVTAQFVRFETDEDGLIKKIDTAATDAFGTSADSKMPDGDNTMFVIQANSPSYSRTVDANYAMLDVNNYPQGLYKTCPVFHVPYPNDGTNNYLNEEYYFVETANDAFEFYGKAEGVTYMLRTYDHFMLDAVAVQYSLGETAKVKTHERFAAVNKVSVALDKDNTAVYKIEVYSQGKIEYIMAKMDYEFDGFTNPLDPSLKAKMTAGDLKHGDLIRYKNDTGGYLGDTIFYYRALTDVINPATVKNKITYSDTSIGHVFVMKKDSDGFMVAGGNTIADAIAVPEEQWIAVPNYSGQSPMMYDATVTGNSKISTISYNDYASYEDVGDKCTEMILHDYQLWPFGVYVIKR